VIGAAREDSIFVPDEYAVDGARVAAFKVPRFLPIDVPDTHRMILAATRDKTLVDVEGGDRVAVSDQVIVLISLFDCHVPARFHIVDVHFALSQRTEALIILQARLSWEPGLPDTVLVRALKQYPAHAG